MQTQVLLPTGLLTDTLSLSLAISGMGKSNVNSCMGYLHRGADELSSQSVPKAGFLHGGLSRICKAGCWPSPQPSVQGTPDLQASKVGACGGFGPLQTDGNCRHCTRGSRRALTEVDFPLSHWEPCRRASCEPMGPAVTLVCGQRVEKAEETSF